MSVDAVKRILHSKWEPQAAAGSRGFVVTPTLSRANLTPEVAASPTEAAAAQARLSGATKPRRAVRGPVST